MIEQTVFVVDDNQDVRNSIKELLASVNLSASLFSSAIDFLSYYQADEAGCLILDIRMPKMSGLELQHELNKMGVQIPIIIITGYADVPIAVEVMKAGAIDVLQKPYHAQNLLDSINKALSIDHNRRTKLDKKQLYKSSLKRLTKREKEIFGYLKKRMTSKMIAKELLISHRTIEIHRKHILEKLRLNSLSELLSLTSRE